MSSVFKKILLLRGKADEERILHLSFNKQRTECGLYRGNKQSDTPRL